jgi:hypothetical protein
MFSSKYLCRSAAVLFVRGVLALGAVSPSLAGAADAAVLEAQVQALSARLAKLEGRTLQPADLVGTYATTAFQSELNGGSPWKVRSYVFDGTTTLRDDGKYTGKSIESGSELSSDGIVNFFSHDDNGRGKWKLDGNKLTLGGMKLYVVGTGGCWLAASRILRTTPMSSCC